MANVTSNLVTISSCDTTTAGGTWAAGSVDADAMVEGAGCLTVKYTSSGLKSTAFTPTSPINMGTAAVVHFWVAMSKTSMPSSKATGGIRLRLESSASDYKEWWVAGNDTLATSGWTCHIAKTNETAQATSGTLNLAAVNKITLYFNLSVKGTVWWDIFRYAPAGGPALVLTGGSDGTPATFADILAAETTSSGAYGVLSSLEGVLYLQGRLQVGSMTNGVTTVFADTNKHIVFADKDVGDTFYDITVSGNGTANTKFRLGANPSSTITTSACLIDSPNRKFSLKFEDDNITSVELYGLKVRNSGLINIGTSSTAVDNCSLIGCQFESCQTVTFNIKSSDTSPMEQNRVVSSTSTDACNIYSLSSTVGKFQLNSFISNTRGVSFPVSGTFTTKGLSFASNTTDIYFSHGSSTVTANLIDSTDNPTASQTSQNWNLYEKTTYNLNLKNSAASAISSAAARVANAQASELFSAVTDGSGNITEQTPARRSRVYTGSLSTTNHNPFVLRMRSYGYQPQEMSKTFSTTAVSDSFVLLDDSYVENTGNTVSLQFKDNSPSVDTIERTTGSFVTDGWIAGDSVLIIGSTSNDGVRLINSVSALVLTMDSGVALVNEGPSAGKRLLRYPSGWTNIAINEATSPDTIEIGPASPNRSIKETYQRLRYLTAQTSNMDLVDALFTADGTTYLNSGYDMLVNTITLTGSDSLLLMPTKDFTSAEGGTHGLKKMQDIDGTQVSLTLKNVVSGSRCYIEDSNQEILMTAEATGSDVSASYVYSIDKNILIYVRKSSSVPRYQPWSGAGVVTIDGFVGYVSQVADPIADSY